MNPNDLSLLKKTYDERHGLQPTNDYDSIRKLHGVYCTVMSVERMTKEEKDGIGDYYRRIILNREPAYYWILDAIYVTSRKAQTKRKYEYFIGILKTWLKYGYGYVPSSENEEIVDYFEEQIGEDLPDSLRHLISELMARYGAVSVTRMIGSLSSYSKSHAYLVLLKELLEEKYSHRFSEVPQLTTQQSATTAELVIVESTSDKQEDANNVRYLSKDTYKMITQAITELLEKSNTEIKVKVIFDTIAGLGLVENRNRDWVLKKVMEMNPSIIKTRFGYCGIKGRKYSKSKVK